MTRMTTRHDTPRTTDAARRGSALLIVIGTLAIIAVFAAIYISIGQGDARVARSVEKRQDTKDYRDGIADHISGVIALDRLDTTVQRGLDDNEILRREAVDLPYTDWTYRSASNNEWALFSPSGRHTITSAAPGALEDYRVANDPWLAATKPTFLGDPGSPSIGADTRPFGSLIQNANPQASSAARSRRATSISATGSRSRTSPRTVGSSTSSTSAPTKRSTTTPGAVSTPNRAPGKRTATTDAMSGA